ncbi:hypothetical protein ABW19_dt0205090 [Dactylella cylindrospora]|nr:hypothetical protein ABW19_dt0205090 [Dactylella cylindrospora]
METPIFMQEDQNPRQRPGRQSSVASTSSSMPGGGRRISAHSTIPSNHPRSPGFPGSAPYIENQATEKESLSSFPPAVATLQIPQMPNGPLPTFLDSSASPAESGYTGYTKEQADTEPEGQPIMIPDVEQPARRPASSTALDGDSITGVDPEGMIVGGFSAKKLGTFEVASLIINKMVGSGIVTGPAQVLLYTGSKQHALLLWGLGFLYTLVSIVIFVEFGYKFRFTGGELVYLDEIFKRPALLFVTIFSTQFILFWNTATNCVQIARQVLACADRNLNVNDAFAHVTDGRLIGFIAIVVTSAVCLLHYFSTAAGRITNVSFAVFKVAMLLVLFGRGAWFSATKKSGGSWTATGDLGDYTERWKSYAYAIFIVLFAYQGWENASFVAGEISYRKTKALRRGYYSAVLIVGVLYLLVNVGFLTSFELVMLKQGEKLQDLLNRGLLPTAVLANDGYAARYWASSDGLTAGPIRAWNVILTLSSLGNVLAVTYTCGRVKQMIGQSYIFPWSRLWSRESRFNTPSGGLLLHWICTSILIIIAVNVSSGGYWLPGSLQAYSHAIVALAVTVAFCFFTPDTENQKPKYQWTLLRYKLVSWPIITLSVVMNLAMIALPIGSYVPDFTVAGWVYAAACFTAVGFSILYYFAFFPVEDYQSGSVGPLSSLRKFSLLRLVGVSWKIDTVSPKVYEQRWERFGCTTRGFSEDITLLGYQKEQTEQFGERRMVYYELDTDNGEPSIIKKIIFWFFGGSFENTTITAPRRYWRLRKPNFSGIPKLWRKQSSDPVIITVEPLQTQTDQ